MPLPTLLVPNNLIIPDAATISRFMNQSAESVVPLQFILTWIKRKMNEYSGLVPEFMVDRILMLVSRTGSGKSTAFPTAIFRLLSSTIRTGASVIVTEPRIANAISIAREQREAPFNRDLKDMIGINTGPIKERVRRGLIFATIGVLSAILKTHTDDQIIEKFRIIVIDECHVRSLSLDIVFVRLKEFYLRNIKRGIRNLPFLILTSATFDADKYAKFFGVFFDNLSDVEKDRVRAFGTGNIISVSGQTYPVETNWLDVGTNDYLKTSADLAVKIHKENLSDIAGKNDIMIFVPGSSEAKSVTMHLNKANVSLRSKHSKIPPFIAIFIDSKAIANDNLDNQIRLMPYKLLTISSVEDEKILLTPFRRIILSTTAMETGVTIDSLKYVIDCGWNRATEKYFPWGFGGLTTRPATQSMITQRKGRAGRLFAGSFYATYTENSFKSLPNIQLPEIMLDGSNNIFLDLAANCSNLNSLDMMDLPPADALHYSVDAAIRFGFIFGSGPDPKWKLSNTGVLAAKFSRIEMFEARIIFMAYVYGVSLYDIINLVAIIGKRKQDFIASKRTSNLRLPHQRPSIPTGHPIKRVTSEGGPTELADGSRELIDLSLSRNVLDYIRNEVKSDDVLNILFSCELIEHSLALQGFMRKIREFDQNPIELLDWCEQKSIKYDGMIEILTRREDIINDLLAAGIDPLKERVGEKKISQANIGELFDIVCRIKRCVYSGLSDNLLIWNGTEYQNKGKKIDVTLDEMSSHPALLAGAIRLTPIRPKKSSEAGPLTYKLIAYGISVIDGYLDIDDSLYMPRTS
jgi:HrpA-like RNA helicase